MRTPNTFASIEDIILASSLSVSAQNTSVASIFSSNKISFCDASSFRTIVLSKKENNLIPNYTKSSNFENIQLIIKSLYDMKIQFWAVLETLFLHYLLILRCLDDN